MTPYEVTLAALLALPTYKEDVADERRPELMRALATEISQLEPPPGVPAKDWRALVVAVGGAETHYALRIVWDVRCKPFECDRGRARTAWQLQSNSYTRPVWDLLDDGLATLSVQARTADKMLKVSYFTCARHRAPFPQATILAFAGRGCFDRTIAPWRGLDLRLEYYRKARRAMG